MLIALTLFTSPGGVRFWSNGAHQNIYFLAATLEAAGHEVIIANGGDGPAPDPETLPSAFRHLATIPVADAVELADFLIEAGAQVSAEHVERMHDRGRKSVTLKFGNTLVIDVDRAIHDLPAGAIYNGARFDEVWTTSQHAETCAAMWETLYRCPVRVLPHVWAADFVEHALSMLPADAPRRYVPGRAKKRVAVLEPNLQWVKTCHVPMLIIEQAYRARPDLIESALVCNAIQMRGRLAFETFVGALDVARPREDGSRCMTFEGRFPTPTFLLQHADVVVSHQWIQTPVYLHYDAMYLGFPLVHNVPGMPGYRYRGFDCIEGGIELVAVAEHHDSVNAEWYAKHVSIFLHKVHALSTANVDAHARAVKEVAR